MEEKQEETRKNEELRREDDISRIPVDAGLLYVCVATGVEGYLAGVVHGCIDSQYTSRRPLDTCKGKEW